MATVLQSVPLGFQWPTVDPFLFCVHHLDHYPAANERLGPAASLAGRDIGQDFAGVDGWRMYHGDVVPGFPQHPHRGFETITFVRKGLVDHSDSLGATARYGRGDVQWMTAGRGIQHAEMFPLLDPEGPNTLELFQIWLNLPATEKMVEPYFSMLWDAEIPRHVIGSVDGPQVVATVVAGELGGRRAPAPPPSSWASSPDSDLALWHLCIDRGAAIELPPAATPETVRVLYVFEGSGLMIDGEPVSPSTGAVVAAGEPTELTASDGSAECLVMQGRPIGEPVAQSGPFVMNTEDEVRQAYADYQRTQFGGWPWPSPDPNHGDDGARFARHADGRVEQAALA
jgi:redox-sensitive bicupin YhaK (pirin superfamily)